MILQRSQLVVDCPVCGRPVEMQMQQLGHEVACGHCRGKFVARTSCNGSLTAMKRTGTNALERAERLLGNRIDAKVSMMTRCSGRQHDLRSGVKALDRANDSRSPLLKDVTNTRKWQPTAILVEHRDEVFARIATDIAEFGTRVIRAKSATQALDLCRRYTPILVVANLDLADQSGWMLATKLQYVHRRVGVWIYQPQSSNYDHGMAEFLNVNALLDYQGNLLRLSQSIVGLMVERGRSKSASCDTDTTDEPAAA